MNKPDTIELPGMDIAVSFRLQGVTESQTLNMFPELSLLQFRSHLLSKLRLVGANDLDIFAKFPELSSVV